MDKLEQYIEQVCKSIGGPFDLRQHVRQELREHLLDAVAQHKAAGLAEADAVSKALEEFGKPNEVRAELESAYGQRMVWIVDKALQWKEMTMRAKWLWTTWAYLALAAVIALDVFFITFSVMFLVPKFQHLLRFGYIDATEIETAGGTWLLTFVDTLQTVGGGYTLWLIVVPAGAWGLFEWRVKSDNKSFMRLSALGSVAVLLTAVVGLSTWSLSVPYMLGAPGPRLVRPFTADQISKVDTAIAAVEDVLAKENRKAMNDWKAMQENIDRASQVLGDLAKVAPAIPVLANWNVPRTIAEQDQATEEMRGHVKAAQGNLVEADQAIRATDAARLETALKAFRKSFAPLQMAAKRPAR
jgi:hypothetical protein